MSSDHAASDLSQIRAQIRSFVARALKGEEVADDEDIFAAGFVNSLFAIELVTFVEKTFGIVVENEDLELENFSSVERLSELVDRKLALSSSRTRAG